MAMNHGKKKHLDAAIEDYERATKLYTAANKEDKADRTLDRTAYLLGKVGRIRDAAYAYQSYAIDQASQDLKKFNVPQIMPRAGVLLLSDIVKQTTADELDFSELRQMCDEIYELDCRLEESREHASFCVT